MSLATESRKRAAELENLQEKTKDNDLFSNAHYYEPVMTVRYLEKKRTQKAEENGKLVAQKDLYQEELEQLILYAPGIASKRTKLILQQIYESLIFPFEFSSMYLSEDVQELHQLMTTRQKQPITTKTKKEDTTNLLKLIQMDLEYFGYDVVYSDDFLEKLTINLKQIKVEKTNVEYKAKKKKKTKMIVASCSTLPGRVDNQNFKTTVSQLCKNPRITAVYIHYPKYCKRLKTDYPPIPEWMNSTDSKIKVNFGAEDCGPLTKSAPLFNLFTPGSDIGVFLFDDDRLYPLKWIEELLDAFEKHKRKAVVARQGTLHKSLPFKYDKFNRSKEDEEYTCVKTASGVIYPFSAFPHSVQKAIDFAEKYKEKASYRNDDMLLASWCYSSRTPIFVIPVTPDQMKEWYSYNNDEFNDKDSLSRIPDHVKPQIQLAKAMMQNDEWPVPWPEVVILTTLIALFIVFIALIIILAKKK